MNDTTTILFGTLLPFFLTSAGSAMVFFFREKSSALAQRLFLGFAAGVMIAASVWGLLMPAIEEAEASGGIGWIPAAGGFVLGAAVLMLLDTVLPHIPPASGEAEGLPSSWRRTTLMVSAVTLHNIPEGMAVGLSLALAVQRNDSAALTAALALSLGIGIQNFPEGAAVSLPLRQDGMGRFKAFVYGSLSGVVEPIFGLLTVLFAVSLASVMPWLLSFAAGAMVYVVVEELIPEAHLGEHSNLGTLGVLGGFVLMMILDVALG